MANKTRRSRNSSPRREGHAGAGSGGATAAELSPRGKWSATTAARAAREARISTAAHLRTASVAHRWEVSRLLTAQQVWHQHLTAQLRQLQPDLDPHSDEGTRTITDAAATLLFGGSGLTEPYPQDLDDAARRLLDLRADDLDAATLYVLSPSMCDIVIAAAQTLTVDDIAALDHDDLPSPTGLLLLPHPLIVRAPSGDLGDDRAYVWTSPATLPALTETSAAQPAVRVTGYLDNHGPVRPDSFRDMAALAAAQGTPLPMLMPNNTRTYPYRPTITDSVRATITQFAGHARTHGEHWRQHQADAGLRTDDQVDATFEYRPGDEIDDADDMFTLKFLYAFWRLCAQNITTLDDVPAGHNARLLAERAGVSPEVRVATLRPTTRTSTSQPASTDWHHRWVVRMHKVRQWYPSEQRHRIIYRGPYLKGPADKPLLGGEVVRHVKP